MHHASEGAGQKSANGLVSPCTEPLLTLLVAGEHTAGRFALVEAVEREGAAHPVHVHSHEDEFVYVLGGVVRFLLDDSWIERGTGQSILLPRGQEHTYSIHSADARLLILIVPAGLEGYYRELGEPVDRNCLYQDAERLVVIAARYGVTITGPPPVHDDRHVDRDRTVQPVYVQPHGGEWKGRMSATMPVDSSRYLSAAASSTLNPTTGLASQCTCSSKSGPKTLTPADQCF